MGVYGNALLEINYLGSNEFDISKNDITNPNVVEKFIDSKMDREEQLNASLSIIGHISTLLLSAVCPVTPAVAVVTMIMKKFISGYIYNKAVGEKKPNAIKKCGNTLRKLRRVLKSKLNNETDLSKKINIQESIDLCDSLIKECDSTASSIQKRTIINTLLS